MIEEAHVPQWVSLLARMTRRRLRLASRPGYPPSPSLPSLRNRIAEFLPPVPPDFDDSVAPETELVQTEPADEYDPLAIPAAWERRALAELEARSGDEVVEPTSSEVLEPTEFAATIPADSDWESSETVTHGPNSQHAGPLGTGSEIALDEPGPEGTGVSDVPQVPTPLTDSTTITHHAALAIGRRPRPLSSILR